MNRFVRLFAAILACLIGGSVQAQRLSCVTNLEPSSPYEFDIHDDAVIWTLDARVSNLPVIGKTRAEVWFMDHWIKQSFVDVKYINLDTSAFFIRTMRRDGQILTEDGHCIEHPQ